MWISLVHETILLAFIELSYTEGEGGLKGSLASYSLPMQSQQRV